MILINDQNEGKEFHSLFEPIQRKHSPSVPLVYWFKQGGGKMQYRLDMNIKIDALYMITLLFHLSRDEI